MIFLKDRGWGSSWLAHRMESRVYAVGTIFTA